MNHEHLLEQSDRLLRPLPGEPGPRPTDLSRAVSAAYHALFHRLIDLASSQVGGGLGAAGERTVISRAFSHGEMRAACNAFEKGAGALPEVFRVPNAAPTPDVTKVARAFVLLQRERHLADYDRARRFTPAEAANLVTLAKQRCEDAGRPPADAAGRLFLLALLVWAKAKKNTG